MGSGVGEVADVRAHDDSFVGGVGGVEVDSGDGLVEPCADRAVGVVVEGVHADVLEALVVGPAVPAFPNRGRTLGDGVEPAWPLLLGEEVEGDVVSAVAGEDVVEIGRADEAGGELGASAANVRNELVDGVLGQFGWHEVEFQGKQVCRLSLGGDDSVRRDVAISEGGADGLEEASVGLCVVFVSEHVGDLAQ